MSLTKTKKKETLITVIREMIEKHQEKTGAILNDVLEHDKDNITVELSEADTQLIDDINDLADSSELFELIFRQLKEMDLESDQREELKEWLKIDDSETVESYVIDHGWILIKAENLNDRNKVESFVRSLYSNLNDSDKYVM